MWEYAIKIGLTVVVLAIAGGTLHWIWTHQIDPKATLNSVFRRTLEQDWLATRDPNKLYQDGNPVAEVVGPVQMGEGSIYFERLANTSLLDTQQPVEYQRLKLRIVRIETAIGHLASPRGTLSAVLDKVQCQVLK
jgi:hypothetical protein